LTLFKQIIGPKSGTKFIFQEICDLVPTKTGDLTTKKFNSSKKCLVFRQITLLLHMKGIGHIFP
jgi:hypothetical protein